MSVGNRPAYRTVGQYMRLNHLYSSVIWREAMLFDCPAFQHHCTVARKVLGCKCYWNANRNNWESHFCVISTCEDASELHPASVLEDIRSTNRKKVYTVDAHTKQLK